MQSQFRWLSLAFGLITTSLLVESTAVHAQRQRGDLVVGDRVEPHWSADGERFWYRRELPQGQYEFILVNAAQGRRMPAFDHAAVAGQLGGEATSGQLPLDGIEFGKERDLLVLVGRESRWVWSLQHKTLRLAENVEVESPPEMLDDAPAARTGADTELVFDNRMDRAIEIFWLGDDGRKSYGKVAPRSKHRQHTFGGHRWAVVAEDNEELGIVTANDTPRTIVLDGKKLREGNSRRRRARDRRTGGNALNPGRSPDGKWQAVIEDHNVVLRSIDSELQRTLSSDGHEGLAYDHVHWSPDSKHLVAFRIEPGEQLEVHLIQSSPEGGGRAQLQSRPYALPGDKFPKYELNIFSIDDGRQTKPSVDRFEHEWERPNCRFSPDGLHLQYEQADRGHQRFRVIDVTLADGQVRNLVDQSSSTFIWTAHNESGLPPVTWLEKSNELLYVSEKSGYRHLYLVDAASGVEKNAVTQGNWVLRGIDKLDEEKRQLWFRASGCYADQDPYLIHYGRVNLDGSGLVWLTAGYGTHSISYSPDRQYLIDSYSRVDLAPVTELRKVSDGSLVCELEKADITALMESGWRAPEVFSAKGRDGQTDIWGIICRPRDFDPSKRYPVIEDIYAGPHGAFVPKSFSPSQRHAELTSLGFIVVQIDGMGTAYRSKAFHDVCWHNLKDAGFEDRIAWMKAAAATRPEMDISRVGIYGTSAGGQNAAAAVLFHPEFYKAAVASCGCHDNRMDKASWNEQWMGYPVGPHYSACSNFDNAHRLQAKLFLIVGEMDTNVPPESTMRLVDALIRADKDFDLLVVPNLGHSDGGPYGVRRMHDFFIEHLKP